ncbi:MAG: hypothetical protein IJC29_02255 [Clostridia bacterium]|nr:hypothetical protein [Clostridia bacterium]
MIEQDTVRLLRECDAGVKMGISALDDVRGRAHHAPMRAILRESRQKHEQLREEVTHALHRFGDEGKNPNPIAKGMSHMKTRMKMMYDNRDSTIASLMVDGCNMGIKSLSRYLNQYPAADEDSKRLAQDFIRLEEDLSHALRGYL